MVLESPDNYNKFSELIETYDSICFYLSTDYCNVCKILKPKIFELINTNFPKIHFCYIDLDKSKEISGQLSIFSIPTVLIYFDGKEIIRASRNISLDELTDKIDRYYKLKFD